MRDEEIIRYFQQSRENTCGRFSKDQLKAYPAYSTSNLRPGFPLFKAGLLAAFLIITRPSASHAQVYPQHSLSIDDNIQIDTTRQKHIFRGVVRSAEDHEPLPGVSVLLKGTTVGTVTDVNGRFEFPEKLQPGDVLFFSFIGLESKEYKIKEQRDLSVEIPMLMCMNLEMMGEVVVAGIYEEPRQGFWSKVKALFTK